MTSREHTEGYYYYWYKLKNIQSKFFLKLFTLDILSILCGIAFRTVIPEMNTARL